MVFPVIHKLKDLNDEIIGSFCEYELIFILYKF